MWPKQDLCDLLGIEHPIIQAPMLGSCTPALASAVSNAGGLGSLACGERPTADIRSLVDGYRNASNRPLNLNFFIRTAPSTPQAVWDRARDRVRPWYDRLGLGDPPAAPPKIGPGFDDARLELLLEIKPAVASFHFGAPGPDAVAALKAAGVKLISSATTVAEARALEAAGMDAVIAQGYEAGGHRGSHKPSAPADGVGALALTPQIVDAVSIPVITAGGVADGRGVAAAFALGASGVQIGTGFLACPEAATDAARRAYLRTASDSDTMVTDAVSGRSARARRSRFAEEMARSREPLPDFVQMYALSHLIVKTAEDDDASFHLYGQAAALAREEPAAEVVARLVREAQSVFQTLGRATV